MARLERVLDYTGTMTPPSRESTSDDGEGSDEDDLPQYTVLRAEPTGDAPPAQDTQEGDVPSSQTSTCEDDLPSTAGDKVRSGNGEIAPVPTQEGDLPPAAGDEVRSSLGEHAPETTQGGDLPPQTMRDQICGPGPSGITATGFNAILAAIRAAGAPTGHPGAATIGGATHGSTSTTESGDRGRHLATESSKGDHKGSTAQTKMEEATP